MADIRIIPSAGAINVTGSADFRGTGGSSILFLTGSGQIGAGTTNPESEFHIVSSGTRLITLDRTGTRSYDLGVNSSGTFLVTDNTVSADRIALSHSGSVGIGTTGPLSLLHLRSSEPAIRIVDTDDSSTTIIGSTSGYSFIRPFSRDFRIIDASGVGLLTVKSGGSIGIGTTGPTKTLHVVGEVRLSSYGAGTVTGTAARSLAVDSSGNVIEVANSSLAGSGTANRVAYWTDSNTIAADADFFFDGTNVGIGTTSTGTYKLNVNGSSYFADTIYNGGGYISWTTGYGDGTTQTYNANSLAFLSNASSYAVRMFISSGGNIGIGTTSPYAPLHVRVTGTPPTSGQQGFFGSMVLAGDAGQWNRLRFDTAATGSWGVAVNPDRKFVISRLDSSFSGTPDDSNFVIDTAGNVGIGLTNPADKLAVSGNISIFSSYKIYNGSAADSAGISFPSNVTRIDGYSGITFNSSATNVGSQTERMRITNDGRVGIGTVTPSGSLHVNNQSGVTSFTSTAFLQQVISEPNGQGSEYVGIDLTGYSSAFIGKPLARIAVLPTGQGTVLSIGTSNSYSTGITNQAFNIKYDGNVGIGTTNPTQTLEVSGNGLFTKLGTGGAINTSFDFYNNGTTYLNGATTIDDDLTVTGKITAREFHTTFVSASIIYQSGSTQFGNSSDDTHVFTGNVGIGTTSPGSRLTVIDSNNTTPLTIGAGSSATFEFKGNSTSGYTTTFNINDTALYIGHNSSGRNLVLQTNSTDRLTIGGSGAATFSSSVTAVSALLQSANTNSVVDIFTLYNPSQTSSGVRQKFANGYGDLAAIKVSQIDNGAGADNGQIEFQTATDAALSTKLTILDTGAATFTSSVTAGSFVKSGGTSAQFLKADGSVDSSTYLTAFSETDTLQSVTTRGATTTTGMTIAGNVGIGTTSADYPLYVYANSNGGLLSTIRNVNTGTAQYVEFKIGQADNKELRIGSSYNYSSVEWNQNWIYSVDRNLALKTDSGYAIRFYTDGTGDANERMRVATGGNVGIGTTTPAGKLDVRAGSGGRILFGSYDANYYAAFEGGDQLNFYNGASNATGYINYNGPSAVLLSRNLYVEGNSSGGTTGAVRINSVGNVGIGLTNPGAKLQVAGTVATDSALADVDAYRIIKPNGGVRVTGNSSETGAIKITYPVSWTNTMHRVKLNVYEYTTNESFTIYFGGYNYAPGGGYWYNVFAYTLNNPGVDRNFTVRFGHDGTRAVVYIGELASGWVYPQIFIEEVELGYGGQSSTWRDGAWAIGFEASAFQNVTETISNPQATNWARNGSSVYFENGSVGIGTTSPTNALDVLGGTSVRLSNGSGVLSIGTSSGRGQYQYINLGGGSGGTDYGWQVGRSPQTGGVINDGFYIYDIKTNNAPFAIALGGNVGIGTTTPSNRLTVHQGGGVRVTGITSGDWIEMSGNLPGYTDNYYPVIKSNGTIHFANNNKYAAFLEGANTYFGIVDNSAVTKVFLATSGNTYFTGGNVGIGTTSPSNTLQVVGGVTATSFTGSLQGNITGTAASETLQTVTTRGSSTTTGMTIAGNVGIGTTSPGNIVEITSVNANVYPKVNRSSTSYEAGWKLSTGGTDSWYLGLRSADGVGSYHFYSYTANSSVAVVQNDGNVGIGTTSPGAPLHVYKSDTYSAIISRADWNSGTSTKLALGKQYGVLGFISSDLVETTNDTSYIALNYKSGLTTYAEGLRVYNNGNVGIGTTSPTAKLHVSGGDAVLRNAFIGEVPTYGAENAQFSHISRAAAGEYSFLSANDGETFINSKTGTNIRFRVNNSDKVIITSAGNVGIGTTNPLSPLHQVSGVVDYTGEARFGGSSTAFGIELKYNQAGSTSGSIYVSPTYSSTDILFKLGAGSGNANQLVLKGNGNVGIGTTAPRASLDVAGGITIRNTRVSTAEKYPLGHYTPGETVFEIDPTWTEAQLQDYFNSTGVSWTADSTSPGGYAIQIDGEVNVGGEYNTGFPYIPVDSSQDDWFYMECWIRNEAGSANIHYMGGIDYNESFVSLGGNPGSYTYNVMSNYNPGTSWTKVYGYWNGFGNSYGGAGTGNTNNWESGTKYFTPQALFNYSNPSGTRRSYISGWKCVRVRATGNRYYSDNVLVGGSVGIGTTSPSYKLDVSGQGRFTTTASEATIIAGGASLYNTYIANSTVVGYIGSGQGMVTSGGATNFGVRAEADLLFAAGGNTERMRITSGGNVGIGTTNPSFPLHVVGYARANGFSVNDSSGTPSAFIGYEKNWIGSGTSATLAIAAESQKINFYAGGTTDVRMMVSSSGNVGIGNTAPNERLELSVGNGVTGGLRINYAASATGEGMDITYLNTGATTTSFDSRYNSDSAVMQFRMKTAATAVNAMTILGNGNIGFGTTSPTTKLNVLIGAGGANGTVGLKIGGTGNYESLELGIEGDYNGQIRTYGNDLHLYSGHWRTVGSTATEDHAIRFFTSKTSSTNWSTAKMILTADGNVGIGSNSPGWKLDVAGNARIGDNTSQRTYAALQVSAGEASATTYRDIDLKGSWAAGEGHAITANHGTTSTSIVGQMVFEHNSPGSRIKFGRLYDSGDQSTYPFHMVSNGSAGRLGIGTSVPTAPLDTLGVRVGRDFSIANRATVRLDANTADYPADILFGHTAAANQSSWDGVYWSISSRAAENNNLFTIWRGGSNPGGSGEAILFAIQPGGNVGIGSTAPAYKLDVTGTIRATGDVIAYSDARVKENIVTLENSLDLVQKLRGVRYNRIGESENKVGVIAQEVLEVLPEVVQQDQEGNYSVAYGNITAVLIEAIKQQQLQIDELKQEIKQLKG